MAQITARHSALTSALYSHAGAQDVPSQRILKHRVSTPEEEEG